jgi:hypothetical protein
MLTKLHIGAALTYWVITSLALWGGAISAHRIHTLHLDNHFDAVLLRVIGPYCLIVLTIFQVRVERRLGEILSGPKKSLSEVQEPQKDKS